jgi:hypothetical protein
VVDENGRIARVPDELCMLVALRDAIRRWEVYVHGGVRWRNPAGSLELRLIWFVTDDRRAPAAFYCLVIAWGAGRLAEPGGLRQTVGMHDRVVAEFPRFIERVEGRLAHMYGDLRSEVRVGVAELLPDAESAAQLTFLNAREDRLATYNEVIAEWTAVHELAATTTLPAQDFAEKTVLRLEDHTINGLVRARMDRCSQMLADVFGDVEEWPADAQLAAVFITWSWPGWTEQAHLLHRAVDAQDWNDAAREVEPRSDWPALAQAMPMFRSAASVVDHGLDIAELHYWDAPPSPEPAAPASPGPLAGSMTLALDVRDQEGWITVTGGGATPHGSVTVTFGLTGKQAVTTTTANEAGSVLVSEQARPVPGGCDVSLRDEASGRVVRGRAAHYVPISIPPDPVRID